MTGRSKLTGDAGARVVRLLATILLMGGVVAGPLAHMALDGHGDVRAASHQAEHGHDHGDPGLPDGHHDCPICITLTSAAGPSTPTTPAIVLSPDAVTADPAVDLHDAGIAVVLRARAPPHS